MMIKSALSLMSGAVMLTHKQNKLLEERDVGVKQKY